MIQYSTFTFWIYRENVEINSEINLQILNKKTGLTLHRWNVILKPSLSIGVGILPTNQADRLLTAQFVEYETGRNQVESGR